MPEQGGKQNLRRSISQWLIWTRRCVHWVVLWKLLARIVWVHGVHLLVGKHHFLLNVRRRITLLFLLHKLLNTEVSCLSAEVSRQGVGAGKLLATTPLGDAISQVALTLKVLLASMKILVSLAVVRARKVLRTEQTLVWSLGGVRFHVAFQVVRLLKDLAAYPAGVC